MAGVFAGRCRLVRKADEAHVQRMAGSSRVGYQWGFTLESLRIMVKRVPRGEVCLPGRTQGPMANVGGDHALQFEGGNLRVASRFRGGLCRDNSADPRGRAWAVGGQLGALRHLELGDDAGPEA
jgi:hypothetical protein